MQLYNALAGLLKKSSALIVSAEGWIRDDWFENIERSQYGGRNHIDLRDMKRESNSYDWIVCNHVLEHIDKDVLALNEMLRVVKPDGGVQITVPSPDRVRTTTEWGFCDESKHGHYRTYGADWIEKKLKNADLSHGVIIARVYDEYTDYTDLVYIATKTEQGTDKWVNGLRQFGLEATQIDLKLSPLS